MDKSLLKIDNLHVSVEDNHILKGLSLDVKPGELHVIMGRNGTGKSTLANVSKANEFLKWAPRIDLMEWIDENKD